MHIWLPVIRTYTGADVFNIRLRDALNQRGVRCTLTWYGRYFELFPWLLSRTSIPDDVDIIHANSWNAFAFNRNNIPLIVTELLNVHNKEAESYKTLAQSLYHRYFVRRFEKESFCRADVVTAVSEDTGRSLNDSFGLSDVKVLTTWVNSKYFIPEENRKPPTPPFKLLFVAKNSRRKGWDLIPGIMEMLGPDYHLVHTGEAATSDSGTAPVNMIPVGRINNQQELLSLYQKCDALLFPSRLEGLSQAMLEAMSCGLPVITSNKSSMPELVTNGKNGILCDSENIDCYVNAIRNLFDDPSLFESLSNNARISIIQRYDEDTVIEKYISLYDSLA